MQVNNPAGYQNSSVPVGMPQGMIKTALYPPPGTAEFKGDLLNCCANGPVACIQKACYMGFCPCLFYGALFAKAGESWCHGCCCAGGGLAMLRTSVRRHYGIKSSGCMDCGCGQDFSTVAFCGACAACQMDLHLDDMAAKGAAMSNGIPKETQ